MRYVQFPIKHIRYFEVMFAIWQHNLTFDDCVSLLSTDYYNFIMKQYTAIK